MPKTKFGHRQSTYRQIGLVSTFVLRGACEQQIPEDVAENRSIDLVENNVIKPIPAFLQQGMPEDKASQMLSVNDSRRPSVWLLSLHQQDTPRVPESA